MGRVRALRNADRRRNVSGGTFHSVAHQSLRRYHEAVGLPAGFGVLDHGDAADLMDLVRGELKILSQERRLPKKATLASLYSRTVNTGMPLADVMREITPWCVESLEEVGSLFTAFVARKRALGLLDFDDLLLYWRVAAQDEALGKELSAAYDHILVDEFQDVNLLQLDVLVGLRRMDPRLTIVGDDAQAIYGFRGATARFLLDADRYFNGLTTITLDANYRSSAAILAVANAIAAGAPEGFTSILHEEVPVAGASQPLLVHCGDERDQSQSVADRVLELYEQGVPLHKQAVLFRAAHHSGDLELELARRHIPFIKYGGLRYLEAAHVKDLLAAFRLADNPRDEMAWFRLLQLMPGVGPAKARRAINALRDPDGILPSPTARLNNDGRASSRSYQTMSTACQVISRARCARRNSNRWSCTRNEFAKPSCRSSCRPMKTRRCDRGCREHWCWPVGDFATERCGGRADVGAASVHRQSGGTSNDRRGLAGPLDRSLSEGSRVRRRSRHSCRRRQLPVGHVDGVARRD